MSEGESTLQDSERGVPAPTLAEVRAGIINSVLREGLKPSNQLKESDVFHMPSKDSAPYTEVEGCIVKPPEQYLSPDEYTRTLSESLYSGERSVLPVLLERDLDYDFLEPFYDQLDRHYQKISRMTTAQRAIVEERVASSFLLVYKVGSLPADLNHNGLIEAYGTEETGLSSDAIAYIIFPKAILDQYRSSGRAKELHSRPIKVIGDSVKRKLMWLKYNTFQVPNYERAIKEVLKETNEPIWVHGVRLPTQADLNFFERAKSKSR